MFKKTIEGCEQLIDDINNKNVRLEDAEAAFEYIISTPYKKINENFGDDYDNSAKDVLIHNLIFSLYNYFGDMELHSNYKIFNVFKDNMSNVNFNPHGMTTEGTYRVLRAAETIVSNNADVSSLERKYHIVDRDDCANILKECRNLLDAGDRMFRGSSKEYKEIQREIKALNAFIEKGSDTDTDNKYIATMLKTLAEKAEQYVSDRETTQLKHSANGYKGVRIANMRKVFNRLNLFAEKFENKYKLVEKTDEYNRLLGEKAQTISFSKTLFAEKNNIDADEKLDVLEKAYGHVNAPDGFCKAAYKNNDIVKFSKELKKLIGNEKASNLKNMYRELKALDEDCGFTLKKIQEMKIPDIN